MELRPKNWLNQNLMGKVSPYSKNYQANNVQLVEEKEAEKTVEPPQETEDRNKSQVDLTELTSKLRMDMGNISSIPNFQSLLTGLQSLIEGYEDVFSDQIGDRPMDIKPIKLVIDKMIPKPSKTMVCRPIPLHWQSEGEKILLDLLQAGIVKRVEELCDFISPSFFVKKGDGSGSPRLVLDYKNSLNPALVSIPHPLPSPMMCGRR